MPWARPRSFRGPYCPMKRICILYDGTWNKVDSNTNVLAMKEAIVSEGRNDPVQPVFYDEGVGTKWYERIRGGLFGFGLSKNIMQGWKFLSERFRAGAADDLSEDDRIYVLGFSRGAYSARSLVGLVRKCGILRDPDDALIERAYEDIYRDRSCAPDHPKAVAFRAEHAVRDRVKVDFIGVWDTVGSLGVPGKVLPFSRGYYDWHDTELSGIVREAYHAVAVDEHRKDFPATMWTKKPKPDQHVEQVWFPGAHANVGGGYEGDRLRNLALSWMQEKAIAAGLELDTFTVPGPDDFRGPLRDSYGEFLFGVYKWFFKRRIRPYGEGAAESVHDSTARRMAELADYRPPTLERFWP